MAFNHFCPIPKNTAVCIFAYSYQESFNLHDKHSILVQKQVEFFTTQILLVFMVISGTLKSRIRGKLSSVSSWGPWKGTILTLHKHIFGLYASPPLCVQMDFTRTFEATTKCNNINYAWSHFYQLLVVLKYHRCL